MKSFLCRLGVAVWIVSMAISGTALAQKSRNDTATPLAGPLGGLGQTALKKGTADELPAHLSPLLWPEAGKTQPKRDVKKFLIVGKKEGEGRVFFIRPDNHDIVLMKYTETVSDNGQSKARQEFYYRTRPEGDLALVLVARLQFAKDLADNDILKDVTFHTYGDLAATGGKPHPITPVITSSFETEKKFWLEQEKKLKKSERHRKE